MAVRLTVEGEQTAAGLVMVTVGKAFNVTVVATEVTEQLFALVTVTV